MTKQNYYKYYSKYKMLNFFKLSNNYFIIKNVVKKFKDYQKIN